MGSGRPPRVTTTRRKLLTASGTGIGGLFTELPEFPVSRDSSAESLPTYLDEHVPKLLDRYDVPGASIALVRDGEVTWSSAYGEADPEEGQPTTEETLFRVQSITKSVTAWGVMKLVEQDEIGIDDPVGDHITTWELPDAQHPWDGVTVQRLLSHSAGLPAGGYESVPPNREPPPLRKALSGEADGPAARPTAEPGSFRYSNIGYALLELLVEEVTGRDYAEYVAEEILEPLGMDEATFVWNDRVRSKVATEHFVDGTPISPTSGPARAHGGLYATVTDIAHFVAAGVDTSGDESLGLGVLEPQSVVEMYTPAIETTGFYGLATDAAGLGYFVETLSDGKRGVMNGGQGAGSWNWFHAVPETGDGVVVLTNSERSLQLITDIVGAWTDRSGLPSVALTRARRWLHLPVWVLVGLAVVLALRLGYGGTTGKRTFAPLSERDRTVRAAVAGLGAATLGLWWTLGRETMAYYLPVIADWIGLALSAVVVLLLLTVLFPRTEGGETA